MRSRRRTAAAAAALLLAAASAAGQSVVTRGEDLHLDVSAARDEIVINLLGDLWTVPATGGVAKRLVESAVPATRPRWSPDARQLAYETHGPGQSRIWLLDVETGKQRHLGSAASRDRHPAWHPSGQRLTFASHRRTGGFDLREIDLATGLGWRLTDHPDDDIEPAWSVDGRDLAWIRRAAGQWSLVLRRFARPPEVLVTSDTPLAAPSWRPDGTLITYFRKRQAGYELRMIILSDPPLDRTLISEDGLFPAPVSWLNRDRLYYSSGDRIRSRGFDDWYGRAVAFRASPDPAADAEPAFAVAERELPLIGAAEGAVVYRAGRLFDGISRGYTRGADVLVENGIIADIATQKDWGEVPVIELPATTLLPGYIDINSRRPDVDPAAAGPRLLSWGVTTLVAAAPGDFDATAWEAGEPPGPRLLPNAGLSPPPAGKGDDGDALPEGPMPYLILAASGVSGPDKARELTQAWQALGVPVLAADWPDAARLDTYLLPAAQTASAAASGDLGAGRIGFRRQVFDLSRRQLVSGLADRDTDGIAELLRARQAESLDAGVPRGTRVPLLVDLRRSRAPVALGSAPNGFPPGLALHAELLALQKGGLAGDQVLKAAGRNAAGLLGLEGVIGEISVGARADLVFVTGDPLADAAAARNLVAVVRNGRFYSLVNLLERAAGSVE